MRLGRLPAFRARVRGYARLPVAPAWDARLSVATQQKKGPRSENRGPSRDDCYLAVVGRVLVVVAVLVDTDRRLGRVADLVEGDRAGDAVVVGGAAIDDDLRAVGVAGALLAITRTARDFL